MVALADQRYDQMFRSLGNEPGLDSGRVTVTLSAGQSYTMPTTDCTMCELGVFGTLPGGGRVFWLVAAIQSIADAAPGEPGGT